AMSYLKDAKAQNQAGTISNADLLQAEYQASQAQLGLDNARAGAALASERLATALHDAPGTDYKIGETLQGVPHVQTGPLGDMVDSADKSRLDLASLRMAAKALHDQADSQWASAFPSLAAFGGINYDKPNQRYIFFRDPNAPQQAAAFAFETG